MRIYITGSSGFIASNLIKTFKEKKYQVISVNRLHSKIYDELEVMTYEEFIDADMVIDQEKNFFIHTAWHGVSGTERNSIHQFENIPLTTKIFQKCLSSGFEKFILFGSQAEYSNTNAIMHEGSKIAPSSFYGIAKNASFNILSDIEAAENKKLLLHMRLFDTYGNGDKPHWILPTVINHLQNDKKISLTAANQIWNYIYIKDLCTAVNLSMQSDYYGPLNLCGDENLPLKHFLTLTANFFSKAHLLEFGTVNHHSEKRNISGNNELLKSTTGWTPKYSFKDGLSDYLQIKV